MAEPVFPGPYYTIFRVPLPVDTPLFTQRVPLAGVEYVLRFDYSGRQDRWYFDLRDINDSPIRTCMKVVCNWDVLRGVIDPRRPKGFLVFDALADGSTSPPTFSDLGRRVGLLFLIPEPVPIATSSKVYLGS